ncbi:hypothetical protein MSBR3_1977 [Methanosarcina barkeri 3]|uniref:Uncharacterized protein n=1 Tax=Methanosarcina barkeri 3 TaxID=1434107 RepID=A0A0E3WWV4_METBA|nr:hypothetical protein [Methanosarcina barkeri]AKB82555.1 hypothetical protein MSBR3_1977 [Methanosarcina barkeri 3]
MFSLIIIGLFSAIFLLSLYESGDLSWVTNDDIGNCGGENRLAPSDVMQRIYENDSAFQNLTKGNYNYEGGGIFNETGESIGYIRINYFYEVTIEMQNGTVLKSIETENSLEDLYKEADAQNRSISIYPQITGGEFYMITIDTPNETVKSIEKVDELPEWTTETVIEEVSEDEP